MRAPGAHELAELLSRTALRDQAAYEALYRATAAKLGEGRAPVSLGLLPSQGEAVLSVSAQALPLLERGAPLAVSIEPPGGSPTGQPAGPVAYQGKLIAM